MQPIATTIDDLPRVCEAIGERFHAEGRLPSKLNPEVWIKTWANLMDLGIGWMWHLERDGKIIGALGAFYVPDPNDGAMVANEAFWYVNEEERGVGLRLLRQYEEWAKEMGVKRMTMVHLLALQPERLGLLYKRRGYEPIETHYIKILE